MPNIQIKEVIKYIIDGYGEFDSFEAAQQKIKELELAEQIRNSELYFYADSSGAEHIAQWILENYTITPKTHLE